MNATEFLCQPRHKSEVNGSSKAELEGHTRQAEERVWLCGKSNANEGSLRLIVDFCLPIIDFVLFGDRQIALNAALRVEEFDLCPSLDEAVGNLELWLEFPC